MRQLAQRLTTDEQFAAEYAAAHQSYLSAREAVGHVEEIDDYSAGGMPTRVKCLHALVAHSLAAGPGVNPVGDIALAEVTRRGVWPHSGQCVDVDTDNAGANG